MLNNLHLNTPRANRAFYFNPEGNMSSGSLPNETTEPELQRAPAPVEEPAAETASTPASQAH